MVRSGEGVNNTSVRAENRRRVAYLLYQRGALSKQAIARELGLSIPTVNLLVSQLKEEGLLTLQSGASRRSPTSATIASMYSGWRSPITTCASCL